MITYSQLIQIITDSTALQYEGIERKIETEISQVLFHAKPLKVITGIRRSGKSFILKRLYRKLIKNEIPAENILFLNLEDDRLQSYLSVSELRSIYELFIAHNQGDKPIYLFLDEIQNISGWEKFVRTIYDSTDNHIYVTGSNAQLLSKEFSSTLGGRILEYTLFSFSFSEVLQLQNVAYKNAFDRAKNQSDIKKYFDNYLNYGGLCEILELPKETKITFRKSLIDKIIINDIVTRYRLQSVELLQSILFFLEKNVGNIVSYRRIANVAKSNENTVELYISYLRNAFIIEKLRKFSWKTKSVFDTNKKFFFTDNLFCHYADIEDKLENLCYQHLQRKYGNHNIFLGRDDKGKEVDFVVKEQGESLLAIQVCYELTDDNLKREVSSLQLFDKYIKTSDNKLKIILLYNKVSKPIPENIQIVEMVDFLLADTF